MAGGSSPICVPDATASRALSHLADHSQRILEPGELRHRQWNLSGCLRATRGSPFRCPMTSAIAVHAPSLRPSEDYSAPSARQLLAVQAEGESGLIVPLGRLEELLPGDDLQPNYEGALAFATALGLQVETPPAADAPVLALAPSVVWQHRR
jgi:hypothetical protein